MSHEFITDGNQLINSFFHLKTSHQSHKDWNSLMSAWDKFHRDYLLNLIKANPELRHSCNELIGDLATGLKWAKLDECFRVLVNAIQWYCKVSG